MKASVETGLTLHWRNINSLMNKMYSRLRIRQLNVTNDDYFEPAAFEDITLAETFRGVLLLIMIGLSFSIIIFIIEINYHL